MLMSSAATVNYDDRRGLVRRRCAGGGKPWEKHGMSVGNFGPGLRPTRIRGATNPDS